MLNTTTFHCEYSKCDNLAKDKFDDNGVLKLYCLTHGQGLRIIKDWEVE